MSFGGATVSTVRAMLIARRFFVSGRVQGVGFRYFTRESGAREGLHGWVRNLMDGRVEAWAEGEADAVDRFERRIRGGPAGARVVHVEVLEERPSSRTGFHII